MSALPSSPTVEHGPVQYPPGNVASHVNPLVQGEEGEHGFPMSLGTQATQAMTTLSGRRNRSNK